MGPVARWRAAAVAGSQFSDIQCQDLRTRQERLHSNVVVQISDSASPFEDSSSSSGF